MGAQKATKKPEAAEAPVKSKGGKEASKAALKPQKREKVETPVVFAFRLSQIDRDTIHKAAGPAKATRFVRSAALAAANGDHEEFDALVTQAKSNLK